MNQTLERGHRVRDAMNPTIVSVSPTDSIELAASFMDVRGVSTVTVVDAQQRCLGVLRRIDMPVGRLLGLRRGADSALAPRTMGVVVPRQTVARHMMARSVSVLPDWPASVAVSEMGLHELEQIPVVDAKGVVIGMISLADAERAAETEHKCD